MFEKIKKAKEKIEGKKTHKGAIIGYTLSAVLAFSALALFMYRNDIKQWWDEKHQTVVDPGWRDEELGELPSFSEEEKPQKVVEYITDENGIQYIKQDLPYFGYSFPLPVDGDEWKMKYENEQLYILNTDYNGKYGNIEYGIFLIDPDFKFDTIYDLRNTIVPKMSTTFKYHGYNSTYKTISISNAEGQYNNESKNIIMEPSQRFVSVSSIMTEYKDFYTKYYIYEGERGYYIVYGIAPPNKKEYLQKILDTVAANAKPYNVMETYIEFYSPSVGTNNTIPVGNIKIGLPDNVKGEGGVYKVEAGVTSPLAGTMIVAEAISSQERKSMENFPNSMRLLFTNLTGDFSETYTTVIDGTLSVNEKYSELISESRQMYFTRGEFTYIDLATIEISPYGRRTKVMGYVMEVGGKDIFVGATYTDSNYVYVKKYLDAIVNGIS